MPLTMLFPRVLNRVLHVWKAMRACHGIGEQVVHYGLAESQAGERDMEHSMFLVHAHYEIEALAVIGQQ